MRPRMIFFLGFMVVDAIFGAFSARDAFTTAMNKVLASQSPPGVNIQTQPSPAWDPDCSSYDPKPGTANRCHSEMMWAREQTPRPYIDPAPPLPTMSKDASELSAMWFGAAMLAGLLALGAAGAGAMWFLRE
jgi:hypothetical protein